MTNRSSRRVLLISLLGLLVALFSPGLSIPLLAATTLTVAPEADARVEQAYPTTNYGRSSFLRASAGTAAVESYLRFTLSGITGSVTNARLRVFAYNGTRNGPAVYSTGNSWAEGTITWNTRPGRTSAAVDDKGTINDNVWVEYDVTRWITGDGSYSFILASTDSDGMNMYAREGATPPQLVLTTDGSAPTPPPPSSEPIAPDWVSQCAAGTIPFEEQAWWTSDFGHVHAGFCAPQGRTISGKYTFNVRLIMHDNPGKLTMLQGQLDSTSYGGQTVNVNVTCPNGGTCSWDRQVTVDTAAFPYDGWHHIRIRAAVDEPDGKQMVTSSFIPVYFSNGKPRQDLPNAQLLISSSNDYLSGRGWYTNAGYAFSAIFDPRRAGERVSGIYRVRVRSLANENPRPITRFLVKLDATHSDPGSVLYDVPGPQSTPVELSIDTTRLANGWHSLMARTEVAGYAGSNCSLCSGQPQTHAGVSKVWFYVQN